MMIRIFLLFLLSVESLLAADTPVRFINDWKWQGPAAPLLLAKDEGFFVSEGLNVTLSEGNGSLDAIPRVANGEFDMGSADINSLIIWRDQNPNVNLKAIFIIYNAPPFAVLGRPSLGVFGPQDLEGHSLGAPAADGAFAQWPALVKANGILADKVTIKDVSFPEREPMLARGEVDAITGYSFTSFINLQENGVPTEDISLMLMSDFGLDLYGNAIIVNPEFATSKPDAVRGFLRATIRGYQNTIAHPAAAISYVLNRNENAKEDIELRRLVMAIGHNIVTDEVRENGLGYASSVRLDKSINQLAGIHEFSSQPASDTIFDAGFLPEKAERMLLTDGSVPDTTADDDNKPLIDTQDSGNQESASESKAEVAVDGN